MWIKKRETNFYLQHVISDRCENINYTWLFVFAVLLYIYCIDIQIDAFCEAPSMSDVEAKEHVSSHSSSSLDLLTSNSLSKHGVRPPDGTV